jgi:hypothetical protein
MSERAADRFAPNGQCLIIEADLLGGLDRQHWDKRRPVALVCAVHYRRRNRKLHRRACTVEWARARPPFPISERLQQLDVAPTFTQRTKYI